MKRLFFASLVCLIASGSVMAAPVGWINPEMGRFSVSGEVGSVTDRDMEQNNNTSIKGEVESVYYVARIDYGLTDLVEIYGRIGGADLDGTGNTFPGNNLSTSGELAWGAGIQGIIYNAGTWNLAADAQYFAHSDHQQNAGARQYDWKEWQVGVQVQGQWDQFHPYLGVKYSNLDIDVSNGADLEAEDNVGVYLGAGFDLAGNWSGYLEGRFIDETAFGGGISYTF